MPYRGRADKSPRPVSSNTTHVLTQRCATPHSRGLKTFGCGVAHFGFIREVIHI